MKKPWTPPFRTGDVVEYTGKKDYWAGEHIILEVSLKSTNSYNYSTTRGAWIDHKDLKLIEPCSRESLNKLIKSINADYE